MFATHVKRTVSQAFGMSAKSADVGIEIELEGGPWPSSSEVSQWTPHSEGSIQGMEYVTKPIKRHLVKERVAGLAKALKDYGTQTQPGHRTSTHIHLNFTTETLDTMLGMMVVYTVFEPLMLRLIGPSRDGNLFCMNTYDTGDMSQYFSNMCKSISRLDTHGWGGSRGKYSSLNIGRLTDLGTMEARVFPESLNPDEVDKWVGWLLTMRDMARSEPDRTFRSLWKQIRQNPAWFSLKVFGVAPADAEELILFGTETAYELTRSLKYWHNRPAPKAKKPAPPYEIEWSSPEEEVEF